MPKIRSAANNDIPEIQTILYDLNKMHLENLPDDYKQPEEIQLKIDIQKYIDDKDHVACVAIDDGVVVGFILGNIWVRNSWILQKRIIANVMDIAVIKTHTSLGLGKKLMQKFEKEVKLLDADEIWVEIYAFNKNALSFYKSCGVEPILHIGQKKI